MVTFAGIAPEGEGWPGGNGEVGGMGSGRGRLAAWKW